MQLQNVRFIIGQQNVEQEFDWSGLQPGTKVHVIRCPQTHSLVSVSTKNSTGSVPHWVEWVIPSASAVMLAARWQIPEPFIARTVEAVQPYVDATTVEKAMRGFASQVRPEHQHKTSEFERNPLSVIFTVLERLEVVKGVQTGPAHEPDFFTKEPLQSYLLLTCFDRLGQPSNWVDFGGWLRTRECRETVEKLTCDEGGAPVLDIAKRLHDAYLHKYGLKNSFFHFVQTVLPEEAQEELLSSIDMTRTALPHAHQEPPPVTPLDKVRYLYQRRNDYTHKAAFVPKSAEWYSRACSNIKQVFSGESFCTTRTLDWPAVLERCVRSGLASYLTDACRTLTCLDGTGEDKRWT